jgi:RecB family exonuclease
VGRFYAAYRDELARLEAWDREAMRGEAVALLERELDAWRGQPVFAYGFEDLTQAEWKLVETLAGRTEVTISLPYEPGRPAFGALGRTAGDLGRLAADIDELPPRFAEVARPAIAHVERALFTEQAHSEAPPPLQGAVRFLEGVGGRGALELVADEALGLIRRGTAPEAIGVVCPSVDPLRRPLETAFASLGVPFTIEAPVRLPDLPLGRALVAILRFAWLGGGRGDLFAFLRSPYSGLARYAVDFVEGRLRGRAIATPERVEEETRALRGGSLQQLDRLREAPSPLAGVRGLVGSMISAAYGLESPPIGEPARSDLRAYEACRRVLDELEAWEARAGTLSREDVVSALERISVRAPGAEPGRVAVLDLMRARTRRFDVAFLLGLEEGSLPRRGQASPLLGDDLRRELGVRLERRDQVGHDRYLFYTACARATRRLYLVRQAANDDGAPREPSPFWEEVASLFPADDVARWTRRRPLSTPTWPIETAPSERERLRALAALSASPESRAGADALARANGWERRLSRARGAFARPTRLRHPTVLAELGARTMFNVTELERFADCSSAWLFDRVVDPKTIDPEVDARLRGQVAHSALYRFFSGLPRELGADRVTPDRVDDALGFMRRCLDGALERVRMEMTETSRLELRQGLWRDLEALVCDEAASGVPLVPSRFEVSFGTDRASPELQRGLELGDATVLSGKIDRIDLDPFSARGIVQDYKAGKGAHSAREIERELRLQIPLYMLVLRDLVGVEPLGGLYRPLAGDRKPRGLLRADARSDAVPGFARNDYLDEDAFWMQVDVARETARTLAGRIRSGDVRHDPRGGECPSWCDVWPMCRVRRP